MALDPKPNFKQIEQKWQKFWLKEKIYKFDPKSKKPIFSIDTPPPYISGRPHMGHAVSYAGFDFIARYKRMAGFNVFLPIGFDDNGHPTERYVEQKHKIKCTDMPREKFIELCRKETELLEKQAKEDFTKLGHSYDWDLLYSTISPKAIKIAQQSFLDLYKKKLVYRTEEPGLWCIHCQTALSQADVEGEERETSLNYVNFKLDKGTICIATTRPELLPACVGIFTHPNDKRHKKLIGKTAEVPIFGQKVKIMTDVKVDPKFGTGIVMVCTFGDKTDIDWWRKHKLGTKIIFDKSGKLNKRAGKFADYGLHIAKEKILEELQKSKLLVKQEPLKQAVGVCWRCKTPVEFMITKQWAIKVLPHKNELIAQAKKINWFPDYYIKRYEDWVSNLSWDWVISRQRHYGVPMPVWYCKKCDAEILPNEPDLPVDPTTQKPKAKCPKCKSSDIKPETDVFDTWMTSSLTPQLARTFSVDSIPYDLRPQGYEIIRTWAFYTILKSYYHFKRSPWKTAMINGLVLGPDSRHMHKSLGNVIEPMEQAEKYGSDAMRYFASTVNVGEDAPFQEKELVHAQKLLIKLWNVARFCEPNLLKGEIETKNIIDRWILSRLTEVIKAYKNSFENYDAVNARRVLEQFFWHEFCDFYLEMIKYRIYGADRKSKVAAQITLYTCLLAILKLFAPFLSYTAEEIYQELFKKLEKSESIHISNLPEAVLDDHAALKLGELATEAIAAIRKWKVTSNMSLGAEVARLTLQHPKASGLEKVKTEIAATMRIKELQLKRGSIKIE